LKKCLNLSLILLISSTLAQADINASKLKQKLIHDIEKSKSNSFSLLLKRWSKKYGGQSVSPLVEIVREKKLDEKKRYIALMGATKIGGKKVAPLIVPFLKDSSWMIRSGSLRALAILKNPSTARSVLPLLEDRSLVVRTEAVHAIESLRPAGAVDALIEAATHKRNFHGGKSQWLPKKALAALVQIGINKNKAPKLAPLLNYEKDKDLLQKTISVLKKITGNNKIKGSLKEQVKQWKTALKS